MSTTQKARFIALGAKLAVSIILTVLLFAMIEFAAGFFLLPREAISGDSASEDDSVSSTLAWLWINPAPLREDPDYLWRNEPLATRTQLINPQVYGSTAEWTIENNSSGFRGPEVRNDRSAKDAYRVLCIGDSVTFGFNADQNDGYPAQLGRILRANRPDKDIEIINAGVPGWTWLQGVRFLEREGLALEPDLVLISHGVNDQLMRALVTDAERLTQADDPLNNWIARLRLLFADTNVSYLIEQKIDTRPPPEKASSACEQQIDDLSYCKRVGLQEIEAAVMRTAQLVEPDGIELIILNLDFMRTAAGAAAKEAARAAGIIYVDPVNRRDRLLEAAQQRRSDAFGLVPAGDRAVLASQKPIDDQRKVIFRVQTPDTDAPYSARGRATYTAEEFEFTTSLNDEGRDGDEKPGDGVFGGTLALPYAVGSLDYMFYRGEDPEFLSLPPLQSTFGERSLHVTFNLTTPVHRFADRFMMAEQTHPNAKGYGMIAKLLAFVMEKQTSFRR